MKKTAMVVLAACAVPIPAQIEADPRAKVQEILDEVAGEMKQVDSLLRESTRPAGAARGVRQNVSRLKQLLDSASKAQKQVVRGIEDLLKTAEKLKGDGD